jgi:predicted site-specific integrase-resolvase
MIAMNNNSEMLRPKEAAAWLGVSLSSLKRWAVTGRLKPVNLSIRMPRYRRRDLELFINRATQNGKRKKSAISNDTHRVL